MYRNNKVKTYHQHFIALMVVDTHNRTIKKKKQELLR